MKMEYGLNFTKGFLSYIDERLVHYYSKQLKREDFLHLFYVIEHRVGTKESNMTELSHHFIRNKFGRYIEDGKQYWKFNQLVSISEKENIIVSTNYSNFEGNNFCKSYGYTIETINNVMEKELELQFCNISDKTYNAITSTYKPPTDPILLKHLDTIKKLDIDIDKATKFAKKFGGLSLLKIVRDIDIIKNNNNIIVSEDNRTGRIFTSFNLMKKELRDFCTFNGEQMISLDLKSSQPYLLASLIMNNYHNNPLKLRNFSPTITSDNQNKEIQKFYDLITKDDIYLWIVKQWGQSILSDEDARNMAKTELFRYLYKKNNGSNSVQDLIKREFPIVFEIIRTIKYNSDIWMILQKLEADIFITVGNKFIEQGCLTVHDSLYFPKSLLNSISSALDSRFSELNYKHYILT